MTWVVNTSSNTCHIYHYERTPHQLTLLKEVIHPELRGRAGDYLTSDRPGHYHSSTAHGAFSSHSDPKSVAIEGFSREIANEINQGRKHNAFDHIILITPPHMLGLLLPHFDKQVKERIINTIQKDLIHLKSNELLQYLLDNTKYHDPS